MAIQMSSATINDPTRQNLKASTVDTSVLGGTTSSTGGNLNWFSSMFTASAQTSATAMAGITADFIPRFEGAMDTYKQGVAKDLAQIEAVESTGAFKGEAVSKALKNFVIGVKEVANEYLHALDAAEKEIINSVSEAYKKQDADVSGNLNTDTATIKESGPTTAAQ